MRRTRVLIAANSLRVNSPARTLSSQGLARLVLTPNRGNPQSSPPDFDSRHFKVPLTPHLPTYNGVGPCVRRHDRHNFGVGRHRALPEVGKSSARWFQQIGDDVR